MFLFFRVKRSVMVVRDHGHVHQIYKVDQSELVALVGSLVTYRWEK